MRSTCLWCLGLLMLARASVKASSRSGLTAMLRLILVPAGGWPRHSQLTGTAAQVCMTRMSPQCSSGVAKSARSTAVRKESTENQ